MSETPPKDKRTKEYKDWKAKYDEAPEGLGDVVEKITEKTGIKKAVKKIFGDDCGCDKRKEKLNRIRLKPVNCFTESQFNQFKELINRKNKELITAEDKSFLKETILHIFGASVDSNCSNCDYKLWNGWINELNKLYKTYE